MGQVVLTPLDGLAWIVVLKAAGLALTYRLAGDTTWWGTALLYAGRWPWLALPLLLVPFALLWRRSMLLPIGIALLLVLGPVMGGALSLRSLVTQPIATPLLRVLTFNVEGGRLVAFSIDALLREVQADLVGFQECGATFRQELLKLREWAVVDTSGASLCFLSRYPLDTAVVVMPAKAFRDAGGAASAARYVVRTPGGSVAVFNVHLETPRHGVEFLFSDPERAPAEIEGNTLLRQTESRVVRRWADSTSGPRIVMGDFNLPAESAIFREFWGDLEDAWSGGGNGFGFTKDNGWIRVRIDHILASEDLTVVEAKVLRDVGSDHLPLLGVYQWR
jgi:endonuclease/exonuclease/phosphatase (EEP) superfamily protein YafD